jgi:hypothetical protein
MEVHMRFRKNLVAVLTVLIVALSPASAIAGKGTKAAPNGNGGNGANPISCNLPESDADALVILSNYYPGYWWYHTDLTIAVQAHPRASDELIAAVHAAIETWSTVLDDCFDGAITLTNVSDSGVNPQKAADIVVHYVPKAGGVVFGGYALCGDHGCPNILVRSDLPPSLGADPYDPEYLGWVTLHEVGHALGLGHATNLLESTDLMGYGWPDRGDPVLSQCDIEGIAFVFSWVFEGTDPHPPAEGPYAC